MKIVATHSAPDIDALTSVWLIKRFLPHWDSARLEFVPAGGKMEGTSPKEDTPIEQMGDDEIITVDTGLGALDHHQTDSKEVCGASLTFDFVLKNSQELQANPERTEALKRIVELVVDTDHFQDVFYPESDSYRYDCNLESLIDGFKLEYPQDDYACAEFGLECLDKILRVFESRVLAEKDMKTQGKEFTTSFGKGFAIESAYDATLKLAQLQGYVVVIRKDPQEGYVRIKARPEPRKKYAKKISSGKIINLAAVYKKIKRLDPDATWFLHVSGKMLLNGSSKNPTNVPTQLSLDQIIKTVEETI